MLTFRGDLTPISSQICREQDMIASHFTRVFSSFLSLINWGANWMPLQGFVLENLGLISNDTHQDAVVHVPLRKSPGWHLAEHWRSKGCCWDAECGFYRPLFGTWSDCSWSCGSPCNCLCHLPARSSNQGGWQAAWIHYGKGWLAGLNSRRRSGCALPTFMTSCDHNVIRSRPSISYVTTKLTTN